MASLNKVLLIGNLTRDPEVRYTPKGTAVADLGLAVSRTYKTESGETKEDVCFLTVVAWGRQAETAGEYLKKGSPIFVEGRLQYETWEKNGEKRNTIKVSAERIQFLSRPQAGTEFREGGANTRGAASGAAKAEHQANAKPGAAGSATAEAPAGEPDLEEDDIPF
jgi:single-strand DNA-binding protein